MSTKEIVDKLAETLVVGKSVVLVETSHGFGDKYYGIYCGCRGDEIRLTTAHPRKLRVIPLQDIESVSICNVQSQREIAQLVKQTLRLLGFKLKTRKNDKPTPWRILRALWTSRLLPYITLQAVWPPKTKKEAQ
jgi:hypothetical protein